MPHGHGAPAEGDPPATSKGPRSYQQRKAKGKGWSGTRGRGYPRSAVCGRGYGRGHGRWGEGLDWEEDSEEESEEESGGRVRRRVGGRVRRRVGGEQGGEPGWE